MGAYQPLEQVGYHVGIILTDGRWLTDIDGSTPNPVHYQTMDQALEHIAAHYQTAPPGTRASISRTRWRPLEPGQAVAGATTGAMDDLYWDGTRVRKNNLILSAIDYLRTGTGWEILTYRPPIMLTFHG